MKYRLTAEVIQAARVNENTEAEFRRLRPRLKRMNGELTAEVRAGLDEQPAYPWTAPVDRLAGDLVKAKG